MSTKTAPQNVENFQARLVEISDGLPKRLRQCAEYLAGHTDRIAVSTVAQLAEAAGVQPSAVMRFCQLMGYSGFSEMQRVFRSSYGQSPLDYRTRLGNLRKSGAGSPSALLAEFVEVGHNSLENLASSVDARVLDLSVRQLAEAEMIHIVGLRRAYAVASYLTYALERMSVPAFQHDFTGCLDHAHAIRSGDVLLAISFAPYSDETVDLARQFRERGRGVISITDSIMSPLWQLSDHAISVQEVDFGAFRALSATLSLALTLAVAVGTARSET